MTMIPSLSRAYTVTIFFYIYQESNIYSLVYANNDFCLICLLLAVDG